MDEIPTSMDTPHITIITISHQHPSTSMATRPYLPPLRLEKERIEFIPDGRRGIDECDQITITEAHPQIHHPLRN